MVRLLMFHTPIGDSFLYTYGKDSSAEGETVRKYVKEKSKSEPN